MASEEIYDDLYENADKVSMEDLLDQHLDMNGGESTDEESGSQGKKVKKGDDDTPGANGPPKYTEEEKKKIKDEFKNAMIQSAQAAGAGNVPEGVKRLINELTNPTIDWRELIDIQIQSTVKDDYTFMKQ